MLLEISFALGCLGVVVAVVWWTAWVSVTAKDTHDLVVSTHESHFDLCEQIRELETNQDRFNNATETTKKSLDAFKKSIGDVQGAVHSILIDIDRLNTDYNKLCDRIQKLEQPKPRTTRKKTTRPTKAGKKS